MLHSLRHAADHGASIVSFNNLRERGLERFVDPQKPLEVITPKAGRISSRYLQPNLGGDMAAVREIVNLQLLFGQLGKPGAGLCPVRGHSNMQGNRTMCIDEKPSAALLDSLAAHFAFTPPRGAGHNTVQAIEAMLRDEVKVLITLSGNLAAAAPDRPRYSAVRCALTVHISTKLNRSHLVPGHDALILPTLGRTDRDTQASGNQNITVEDSFSMVHASQGVNPPISDQLRSETAIVTGIAAAVLDEDKLNWRAFAGNYDLIRDHIAVTQPGFNDFNRRCDAPGGFYLGNAAAELRFTTPTGKAQFSAAALPASLMPQLAGERAPFTLQTLRSHDQYNTTIYGLGDRYRGVYGQREVVFIHPQDLAELGLKEGDRVDIETLWHDGVHRKVTGFKAVSYAIPRGSLAAYYPETNPMVPLSSFGDGTFTPTSKSVPVKLTPSVTPVTQRIL